MEYRIMIHPSGDLEKELRDQLATIATNVYDKNTANVIFRIKTTQIYENRRKLFMPGNGAVVDMQIPPHITLSQKIEIDEKKEDTLVQRISSLTKDFHSFTLRSSRLGDYGENFTIFLSFEKNETIEKLMKTINERFSDLFPKEIEKRDVPHITLIYDDAEEENFKKAWKLLGPAKLINKQMEVYSLWLWKIQQEWIPYKEFKLK